MTNYALTNERPVRKLKVAGMLLLLMGSTLAMAATPASAITVDGMDPADGAILGSSGSSKVTANVTGYDAGFAKVNTTSEWGQGTFGNYTQANPSGVQLRDISRDDFGVPGSPDASVWDWNDPATVSGGVLTLQTDSSNASLLYPYLRMREDMAGFDLASQVDLNLSAGVTVPFAANGDSMIGAGWLAPSATNFPRGFGVIFTDNGSGGVAVDFWTHSGQYTSGFEIAQGESVTATVSVVDGPNGMVGGSFTNASGTFDLGTYSIGSSLSTDGTFVPAFGKYDPTAFGTGVDSVLEVDWVQVSIPWYPPSGVYTSAPIDTGLFAGAYAQMIVLNTTNGAFNGIQSIAFSSSNTATGPWTASTPFAYNSALDMPVDRYVRFEITMTRADPPSWPTNVEVHTAYHTDVALYWYEDIPAASSGLSLNPTSWNADSTALSGQGLQLSSTSAATGAVGVTYKNASWTLGSSNAFAGAAAVAITNGNSPSAGGDAMMLLAGAVAWQGTTQAGYVGVVRECCSQNATPSLWLVSNDGSTTTWGTMRAPLTVGGNVVIRFSMVDDVFSAWALEEQNRARGWISLGSASLTAPTGSDIALRFGSVGTSSSSQEAVLDWVALKEHDMVAALGDEWESTGGVALNEDLNTRAVIAISGPLVTMQVSSYRHDTTPPVGSFTINNGATGVTSLIVNVQMTATDTWGVAFYAASESLSFPEGWKPYPSDGKATFLLSSGDARKVVWMRFMDTSGVISEPVNQTVVLDTVDPTGALYLNDRASTTSGRQVNLTLLAFDGGGIDSALVSNSPDLSAATTIDMKSGGVALQAVTKVVQWNLSAGDGVKTVFVQFLDIHGRFSSLPYYNASILLDSTAPTVTATLLNTLTRDNTLYLNSTLAIVRVSASDASGLAGVYITDDPTGQTLHSYPTAGDLLFDLPAGSGARTLYVKAVDVYGLASEVIVLDFFVDVSAPTGSITINNDDEVTTSRTVTLQLSATDNIAVAEMQLSTSLYFLGSVWQPFSATASLDLSAGDGAQKTVYVRYRDVNGRESQAFFDTIALDTTPPTGFIIVNNGDVETIDRNLNLQLEAFDNFEGTLEMRVGTSPDLSVVNWQPFSENFRVDAGTDEGNVTVYYQIRDSHGLVSETYTDGIRVRRASCADTNSCPPLTQPGFEGAYVLVAVGLVGAVAVLGRRRRD